MVEEEKQNIENEKRAAMAAMSELVEGRKRFEQNGSTRQKCASSLPKRRWHSLALLRPRA